MPPATPSAAAIPDANPTSHVHLVFKTHLDIGFTDLAATVIARYLDDYLPKALALAETMRAIGPDRFVWTTGSWLIWRALTSWKGRRRKTLEQAIISGDIRWHALPFTTHTELMDAALFRRGLGISHELDRRFGRQTIAAKMTDVPGHTRAIVPLLAEAGVRLLHLGVNPASRMPVVPPVFRWAAGGAEVLVVYNADYGLLAHVPGGHSALAFGFTGDNHGPPGPDRIADDYRALRVRFPGATVAATALDAFARDLLAAPAAAIPTVTQEIGDTWIHGAGTDPQKLAGFRALQRLHRAAAAAPSTPAASRRVEAFGRALLMVPEHTWGLDIKTHLTRSGDGPAAVAADRRRYRAADFAHALRLPAYRRCVASWREQRAYLDAAVAELGASALGRQARDLLAATRRLPRWSDIGLAPLRGGHLVTDRWDLRLDPISGAIIGLTDRRTGRAWADPAHPIARFRHQSFAQADYDRWLAEYARDLDRHAFWAVPDFTKPGMDVVPARSALAAARRARIRHRALPHADRVVVDLRLPAAAAARGCPRDVRLTIDLPRDPVADPCAITLAWRRKTPTRLPEATWLDLHPAGIDTAAWRLHKLDHPIDPLDVVPGGGRFLHAADRVTAPGLTLDLPDSPLVAPGGPRLLRADDTQPDLAQGLSINLHNNLWGTNFPMWYGEDARFSLSLHLA